MIILFIVQDPRRHLPLQARTTSGAVTMSGDLTVDRRIAGDLTLTPMHHVTETKPTSVHVLQKMTSSRWNLTRIPVMV